MTTSRPNSFFGLDSSPKVLPLSLGDDIGGGEGGDSEGRGKNSVAYPKTLDDSDDAGGVDGVNEGEQTKRVRPSSFFGMEQPTGHIPNPSDAGAATAGRPADAGAAPTTATTAFAGLINRESAPSPVSIAPSQSASNYGSAERSVNSGGATRPASIAPTLNGPLLDHSHLRPGEQAALLSHNKTLELYRMNAKKTNDPELIYELAVFMIDAAKSMGGDDSSGGSGPTGSGSSIGLQGKEETARDDLFKEAVGLLKKIADRGHPDAQYFLADCYANGIGTTKGKQDFDKAYPLFVLAAKHGHPDAAYRAGMCYEKGWGCRRDPAKALQFYRKAGAQSHPGAMYRLGTAELNGDLGMKKSAREGVKWLKRSADAATPEFPHALHELALLHERGIDNVLFTDPEYSCELLAQAGEMGYAPSAYKLGVNYEYGRMGCPQDAGLSIHMYNIAAQQDHKEACFALTAWYLVGAPGILPQSDTEAYLWAKKAAEQGLAKAEYAVGYFTEMGIGCVRDMPGAQRWYRAAAEHGDKRANQRLASLGVPQVSENKILSSLGIRRGSEPAAMMSGSALSASSHNQRAEEGVNGLTAAQKQLSAREQGLRIAADTARHQQMQQSQPSNAPFPSAVERSGMSPVHAPNPSYPSPMLMREVQTTQREQAHQIAILQHQRQQQQAQSRPPPPQGQAPMLPPLQQQNQQQRPPMSPQQQQQQQRPPMSPQQQQQQQQHQRSPPLPLQHGSPQQFAARPAPQPGQGPPSLSPQLQQQFQSMQMRGGPNMPPRPPMQHDYLRNGAPNGGAPSSVSSHASTPSSRHSSHHSQGHGPPPNMMRRPPHGAEVAYLQHPRPQQPPHHAQFRPPFRPPQRQNSAPPGTQNGLPDKVGYPTYPNLPNPEHTYRPGIPVTQQPQPSELGAFASVDSEKKKSLWQQLKAI